ncbi:IgA peptidase M64-domain-containing protein [Chytriomyces sp. MP71]|nr:IgA peptidase M64-domain-containing protein [Chytriomyces sp. MP71]
MRFAKEHEWCAGGINNAPVTQLTSFPIQPIVKQLINSGPSTNRIDVTFMGDGYTKDQQDLFFGDIQRLVDEMWSGGAFDGVLPLFNVWAVFVPSREAGIGTGDTPRDTVFGLYRDGTELRGIYPSYPEVARAACKATGPNGCDFPSLIGNDAYYGGLGGEFTIGTSSKTTGSLVLRHEFGHTLVNEGEEYDGGEAYFGSNSAYELKNIKWKKWLSEPPFGKFKLKEQRNTIRVQDYSWYDLAKGPYQLEFSSDGTYNRWYIRITASGVEQDGSLEVYLDGKRMSWQSHGNLDRGFHDWTSHDVGFTNGTHKLEFRQGFPPTNTTSPIRQLCSVTVHEYAAEPEYHFDPDYVGAFPTYSLSGKKSYRPTHESCLMRNMTSPVFCPVCKEGLFLSLLDRISLIDSINTSCEPQSGGDDDSDEWGAKSLHVARLNLLKLAHLREKGKRVPGEKYNIKWIRDGVAVNELDDKEEVRVKAKDAVGDWSVSVRISTPLVRDDPDGMTVSRMAFVWHRC